MPVAERSDSETPRMVAALVRHGDYAQPAQTPSARLPYPLTDAGQGHARAGAKELVALALAHDLDIHPVVDASRLLRAYQTARIIASRIGAEPARVEEFDALNERSVGSAANLSLGEIEAVIEADPRYRSLPPGWKSNSTHRLPLPGAESLIEAGARVVAHIERRMFELAGLVERDTLKVFVGHGGAFRHAAAALGLMTLADVPGLSMHHGRPVLIERLPDGRWQHFAGEWKVRQPKVDAPD